MDVMNASKVFNYVVRVALLIIAASFWKANIEFPAVLYILAIGNELEILFENISDKLDIIIEKLRK